MSRARGTSEASKPVHPIGLKVLRLSKPSMAHQYPIPQQSDIDQEQILHVDSAAAYSHPASTEHDGDFVLSPLLALPPSFGAVHVGETFSCTLCATNELPRDGVGSSVAGVRLTAEMQTPSRQQASIPVEIHGQGPDDSGAVELKPGEVLQRIVRCDLREEGNHVLVVTVSYTDSPRPSDGSTDNGQSDPPTPGPQRTFRKLYQFPAHQLLSVRTKARLLPPKHSSTGPESFVLEAQLENLDDKLISLESISMLPRKGLVCKSLNAWDIALSDGAVNESPSLGPGSVLQAAFRVEGEDGANVERTYADNDEKRVVLGHLSIRWRSTMGEAGSLNTGWLTWKQR